MDEPIDFLTNNCLGFVFGRLLSDVSKTGAVKYEERWKKYGADHRAPHSDLLFPEYFLDLPRKLSYIVQHVGQGIDFDYLPLSWNWVATALAHIL